MQLGLHLPKASAGRFSVRHHAPISHINPAAASSYHKTSIPRPVSCPADPQRHETAQTDSDQQQQVQQQQQGAPPVQRERDLVIPVAVAISLAGYALVAIIALLDSY